MRKPPHPLGLSGCVRTRLVHIPPPRGHESRFPSARLRKQRGGRRERKGRGLCLLFSGPDGSWLGRSGDLTPQRYFKGCQSAGK